MGSLLNAGSGYSYHIRGTVSYSLDHDYRYRQLVRRADYTASDWYTFSMGRASCTVRADIAQHPSHRMLYFIVEEATRSLMADTDSRVDELNLLGFAAWCYCLGILFLSS